MTSKRAPSRLPGGVLYFRAGLSAWSSKFATLVHVDQAYR